MGGSILYRHSVFRGVGVLLEVWVLHKLSQSSKWHRLTIHSEFTILLSYFLGLKFVVTTLL